MELHFSLRPPPLRHQPVVQVKNLTFPGESSDSGHECEIPDCEDFGVVPAIYK